MAGARVVVAVVVTVVDGAFVASVAFVKTVLFVEEGAEVTVIFVGAENKVLLYLSFTKKGIMI